MAYSLVSPEEMCYLIDLHLFLGAPVQNKPAADAPATPSVKEAYYGSLPRHLLDLELEWARDTTANRTDLVRALRFYWLCLLMLVKSSGFAAQVHAEFDENVLEDCRHCRARVGATRKGAPTD